MATYAIGDVQGCLDELKALLLQLDFNSDRDTLWFCGDLVNRGPQSLQTLRFVKSLEDNATTVLGNHDLHLLATAFDHQKPGKKDTLHDILEASDADQLLNWLRQQPLIHHDAQLEITLVHAGLHPEWDLNQARSLAAEVEHILQSKQHIDFYRHMYGDKPDRWQESLTGWSRFRFITNVLTRIRYLNSTGKPVLSAKGPPGKQGDHLTPWYEVPERKSAGDKIIFGHWSTLPHAGKQAINNTYALDSGCLWGGTLTAMRIDDASFEYSRLNCPGTLKPGKEV